MNIAILGATSQIAKDLVISFREHGNYNVTLFSRSIEKVQQQFAVLGLTVQEDNLSYHDFSQNKHFDVIINFVGVGDPAVAKQMGSQIFDITEQYDKLAIDYIKAHPDCQYIFISSGAVYGGNFEQPVSESSVAQVNINHLKETDWYAVAKLYAEAKHRALANYKIVDVRVFNYFSHAQDMNARFLITDMIRSVQLQEVFRTNQINIFRDFMTPASFASLVNSIIGYNSKPINCAVDCYTLKPVSKFELISAISERYGLQYEIVEQAGLNATGMKLNYFSKKRSEANFSYIPIMSSLEGIMCELSKKL